MNYWKHIDLPQFKELQEDLAAWFIKNPHGVNGDRWNEVNIVKLLIAVPRLSVALRSIEAMATYIAAIVIRKKDETIIHIDQMPGVKARLLLPVMNTEGSFTAFYETESAGRFAIDYDDGGKECLQFDSSDVTEVTRFSLTAPTILRIDHPHAILCEQNQFPRISLSIRLNKDPVWMLT